MMIRATVLVLALSTTSAFAQDATDGTTPEPVDPTRVAHWTMRRLQLRLKV